MYIDFFFFFFQAEDGIRDVAVTGVQTCALPIYHAEVSRRSAGRPRRGEQDPEDRHDPLGSALRGSVGAAADRLGPGLRRSEERRVGKECRSRWSPYH